MASTLTRPLLRTSPLRIAAPARRLASTTAAETATAAAETSKQAAATAKDAAADYTAKAASGLSRVSSSAGPALAGAAKGVGNALSGIGGRTGKLIGVVERQTPIVMYYSRVGLELSRMVFKGQKMSPPSISTFQSYFNNGLATLRDPHSLLKSASSAVSSTSAQGAIKQIRGMSNTQLAAGAVVAAEVLGFFTVGEMLGRFKFVGYHGEKEDAHH